jgi:hypothetical protein
VRPRRRCRLLEVVGFLADESPRSTHGAFDRGRTEFSGGHAGDAVDQLVRLVDDDHVVLGQHRDAFQRVDGQQRVVGDDDVGVGRLLAGELGEAGAPVRALRGPDALAGGHRHLPPGSVRHSGHQLVAVPGLRVGGPLANADDVSTEQRRGLRGRTTPRHRRARRPRGDSGTGSCAAP